MIQTLAQRCFIVLSVVAILGLIAAVPLGSAFAGDKSGMAKVDHTADAMPCHKPVKSGRPCPDCPQKSCPEGAACLVKCFQHLSAVLTKELAFADLVANAIGLRPNDPPPRIATAPPLRPPIV